MALFNSGSAGADRPGPTTQEGGPMGLKEYSTVINGQATTLQLSDEDARRQGLLPPVDEAAELRGYAAELETKLMEAEDRIAASKTKERDAVEALEKAEAELAQARAATKEAAPVANKQAPAPQNKAADAKAPKA